MPVFKAGKIQNFSLQHPVIFGVLVSPWTILIVRVPSREFRFLAPLARQHLFLNLNQLILWRRIRICLLSFRLRCECCQTNGFARPVLRDRVSLATKVTCATAHSKVCSFCPRFRLFCSIIINFSKKNFAHQWLKCVYSTVGKVNFAFDAVWAPKLDFFDTILFDTDFVPGNKNSLLLSSQFLITFKLSFPHSRQHSCFQPHNW